MEWFHFEAFYRDKNRSTLIFVYKDNKIVCVSPTLYHNRYRHQKCFQWAHIELLYGANHDICYDHNRQHFSRHNRNMLAMNGLQRLKIKFTAWAIPYGPNDIEFVARLKYSLIVISIQFCKNYLEIK